MRALLALLVVVAAGFARAQGPADFDGDAVSNAQDNCDWASNANQFDTGGVASAVADGIGDACQCGDLYPNGRVDLGDSVAVQRVVAGLAAGSTAPDRCSVVGGSSDCDAADALAIRQALAGDVAAVTQVCRAAVGASELPAQMSACGDSITRGYNADCDCNLGFSCLLCLLEQEKPEYSWWNGASSSVWSVRDRYLVFGAVGATLEASESGARMNGGAASFSIQADRVLAEIVEPDLVAVLLGGNDICSRDCASPANCTSPLFTDAQWTAALRAGLDKLVAGLPLGSTIYLLSVPRVQDLRAAGLTLQDQESDVDCELIWESASVCLIVTQGGTSSYGETLATRLAAVSERQRRYNEILRDEAAAYTANSVGQNPRGIEVVAEYVDELTPSIGTFVFGPSEINGGDCFHPSLLGQNRVAELAWRRDPVR